MGHGKGWNHVVKMILFATSFQLQENQQLVCCNFRFQLESIKNDLTHLIEKG